jgi:hypothetical protein
VVPGDLGPPGMERAPVPWRVGSKSSGLTGGHVDLGRVQGEFSQPQTIAFSSKVTHFTCLSLSGALLANLS